MLDHPIIGPSSILTNEDISPTNLQPFPVSGSGIDPRRINYRIIDNLLSTSPLPPHPGPVQNLENRSPLKKRSLYIYIYNKFIKIIITFYFKNKKMYLKKFFFFKKKYIYI